MSVVSAMQNLQAAINKSILGQNDLAQQLVIALLCNGNLLLEGLPGTAKTRAVKSLAKTLDAKLSRIQFTPDLLPSDVTGAEVFHNEGGEAKLVFQPGPLFANIVLADEINRAPAKVQSALLEAMEERQITVAGQSYAMSKLFIVLATQNPIDQEGTYPLPEAQMDRFLMKVLVDYPDELTELEVIRLVREEEAQQNADSNEPQSSASEIKISQEDIFLARRELTTLHINENVERYIVALIMATREPSRYPQSKLGDWLAVGASPRASIAMDRCSRAVAWLGQKAFVDPDDVRAVAHGVLRHRLVLSYEAIAEGVTADDIVDEIIRQVAVA